MMDDGWVAHAIAEPQAAPSKQVRALGGQNMGSGLNARRDMFGHDRLGQAQPAHAHSTQKTASLSSHRTSRQIIKNQ